MPRRLLGMNPDGATNTRPGIDASRGFFADEMGCVSTATEADGAVCEDVAWDVVDAAVAGATVAGAMEGAGRE